MNTFLAVWAIHKNLHCPVNQSFSDPYLPEKFTSLKKKILIIENDQDIRQIVELILNEQGFETLSIPEPDDLLEIIPFTPDVILLDEFINNRAGHRLCRKIKQVPVLAAIPVIILSTANDIELIATECEANDYIRKPFDVEEIVVKVVRNINHQPLSA